LALAGTLFFGGVVAMIAAAAITMATTSPILYLAGFAAILVSPWPFSLGGLPGITQTEATPDAVAVSVYRPHSRFRDQLNT
jgi:hypothetical protein